MKKAEIILELQKLGVEVNPNATKEVLLQHYKNLADGATTSPSPSLETDTSKPKGQTFEEKMLEMMSTVVGKVDKLDKEVQRMKDGGINEYKDGAKPEDVEKAEGLNSKLDPRIAKIIENTLGVDFSADVTTFQDKPGFLLNVNVPKRLSPIPMSYRPVVDNETGAYKIDPVSKRVVEEEYWPGDKRSVALGSTDSFDIVQQHCNRVRAFILATYQKTSRPQPEFRTR